MNLPFQILWKKMTPRPYNFLSMKLLVHPFLFFFFVFVLVPLILNAYSTYSYISYYSRNSFCTQESSGAFDLYRQITWSWTWSSSSKSTRYYSSWSWWPTSSIKSQWRHSCIARVSRSYRDSCERERSICDGPKLGRMKVVNHFIAHTVLVFIFTTDPILCRICECQIPQW